MPVPTSINDLSQTAGSNFPLGSESPTVTDDYLRTYASYIALHRDGKGYAAEATLASASTADIGAQNSFFVQITGTTTITSFGTNYNGPRFVRFSGALTLTHNASTLALPGGANITTAAGDRAILAPVGNPASGWQVLAYQRAASLAAASGANNDITSLSALTAGGLPDASVLTADIADGNVTPAKLSQPLTRGTAQNTTSGTSIDFTGIPSWVKRITLVLAGVSGNGTSNLLLQLGDSGGIENSGYTGGDALPQSGTTTSGLNSTAGFALTGGNAAALVHDGELRLHNLSGNLWVMSGILARTDSGSVDISGGSKTLSATLDRIRLTTVNGTDVFDAGSVNIFYE